MSPGRSRGRRARTSHPPTSRPATSRPTHSSHSFFPVSNSLFIASRVLDLDATAVAAASNYFLLARTLYYLPHLSPLSPQRAVQIFIFLDWIVGVTACVGLSHVYNDDEPADVRLGKGFVRASLVLQGALYGFYLLVLGVWHRRARKERVEGVTRWLARAKRYLTALHACSVLISIRCLYRVVEYFQHPTKGYLARHKVFFYVLDAVPILEMVMLLNPPGKVFPGGLQGLFGRGWSEGGERAGVERGAEVVVGGC